jgi:FlaA1/EpsC-like NDP-sugar epimerase
MVVQPKWSATGWCFDVMKGLRQKIAFGHDLVMAALSFPLALLLRLGYDFFNRELTFLLVGALLFAVAAGVSFLTMRLYGGVWRYASTNDLTAITKAVTLAILFFLPAMFIVTRLENVPRSTLVIQWFVLMALLGGPRFIYRQFKDRRIGRDHGDGARRRVPVLLVGAGDSAELFIRGLNRNAEAAYQVVGLVDEKGGRVGRNIHGVHVLGDIEQIPAVVERLGREKRRPQRLIVTKENIEAPLMRRLVEIADKLGLTVARLPRLTDFRNGVEDAVEVRPIAVEDVLGRAQHVLDRASMQALIRGRRVLVTGAGGTIGGELARQVAAFGPAALTLVDSSEYALYTIDLQIKEAAPTLERASVIADVRDRSRMRRVMKEAEPEIVFHAAALKHVPVVEAHPSEGVLTNVEGTRIVADCCREAKVEAMVLISTDKAVNPTSVMGASKRIAETYCQALDLAGVGTRYITVRFGNVLGSTGSVVPLFQRQLSQGGPLTVTHPEMKRYFMTVREAVELVLEATVLGMREASNDGKIYVLDMGEPVRILDLAKQMILLAGLRPDEDIRIEITGMRPGEKLFEEILHDSEPPTQTEYAGILLAAPRTAPLDSLAPLLDGLADSARAGDDARIAALIAQHVPEYQPEAGGHIRVVASHS